MEIGKVCDHLVGVEICVAVNRLVSCANRCAKFFLPLCMLTCTKMWRNFRIDAFYGTSARYFSDPLLLK